MNILLSILFANIMAFVPRYSLIHFYDDVNAWELYDLKNDPEQMHNIYGEKGTEKITKKLKKELHKLQNQYDDPIRFKLKDN